MKVFIFGNIDLQNDSLPLRILPALKKEFPNIQFEIKDPNEEWDSESEELVILDTAVGIRDVEVFNSLEIFTKIPNITMHDFDALTNLRYLQKLGKIKKVKIIAVPPGMLESEAIKKVSATLR